MNWHNSAITTLVLASMSSVSSKTLSVGLTMSNSRGEREQILLQEGQMRDAKFSDVNFIVSNNKYLYSFNVCVTNHISNLSPTIAQHLLRFWHCIWSNFVIFKL